MFRTTAEATGERLDRVRGGRKTLRNQISNMTSRGKKDSTNGTITDTISGSQVNSNFPYRWSPTSLILNNYFYLFLYLCITRITINNNTPHLKSPKNQNRRAALGRSAMKLLGDFNLFAVDQTSPLVLPWFLRQLGFWFAWKIPSS